MDFYDLAIARQGTVKGNWYSVGSFDVSGIDCLNVQMRFGTVSRISAATNHFTGSHALSRLNRNAALLQMTQGNDCSFVLQHHIIEIGRASCRERDTISLLNVVMCIKQT